MMDNIKPEIIAGEAAIREIPNVAEFSLIGSAMYLPAEACGDVDFVVLVQNESYLERLTDLIMNRGFQACGEQYECSTGTWGAARRGNLNLIVTHDKAFYEGYKLAMEVCKALRLTNKLDRIAACKVVRDRVPADKVRADVYGERP
jgi:acetolactate synthase regulatory subunit